jgi:hypothetical protein
MRPSRRDRYGTAYDSTRHRILIWGGLQDATRLSDLWERDANIEDWTEIATTGTPAARFQPHLMFDPFDGSLYLYGGFDSAYFTDIHRYVPTSQAWEDITPTLVPRGRQFPGIALDSVRRKILLFGGWDAFGVELLADTWEFDLTLRTWKQTKMADPPAPREGSSLFIDDVTGDPILFGGSTGVAFSAPTVEFYRWTPGRWVALPASEATLPPEARTGPIFWDRVRRVLGLAPGVDRDRQPRLVDWWEWDLPRRRWTKIAEGHDEIGPIQFASGLIPTGVVGGMLYFGGRPFNRSTDRQLENTGRIR